jgi:hypothetical protein
MNLPIYALCAPMSALRVNTANALNELVSILQPTRTPLGRGEMSVALSTLDKRKALELIVYLTNRLSQASFHSVSKVLYFADKLHLERYGRLISGDRYIAMENGPVPSWVYDLMKAVAERGTVPASYKTAAMQALEVDKHWLKARRDADTQYFSKSEIACLDESIAANGKKSFGQLTDESHDDAWRSVDENSTIPVETIAGTLPNADEVIKHLSN